MCRRCGEPDRRPGAKDRRRLTRRLLEIHGNGVICPCWMCGTLLSALPGRGYLTIPAGPHGPAVRLPIVKLERDRIVPKGPYSLYNLLPACGPCNRARSYEDADFRGQPIPEGCNFG